MLQNKRYIYKYTETNFALFSSLCSHDLDILLSTVFLQIILQRGENPFTFLILDSIIQCNASKSEI